jgi:hypothetical protein
VKERPILFNAPMVCAILSGQKTQTRRVVKLPRGAFWRDRLDGTVDEFFFDHAVLRARSVKELRCPYGVPGDRLWVRESAYIAPPNFGDVDTCNAVDNEGRRRLVGYAASMDGDSVRCAKDYGVKQTSSIHMPRWAARLFLRVTAVRCERLQEIDDRDAMREGVSPTGDSSGAHVEAFKDLWGKINGAGSWESNPWVWVVSFKRVAQEGTS